MQENSYKPCNSTTSVYADFSCIWNRSWRFDPACMHADRSGLKYVVAPVDHAQLDLDGGGGGGSVLHDKIHVHSHPAAVNDRYTWPVRINYSCMHGRDRIAITFNCTLHKVHNEGAVQHEPPRIWKRPCKYTGQTSRWGRGHRRLEQECTPVAARRAAFRAECMHQLGVSSWTPPENSLCKSGYGRIAAETDCCSAGSPMFSAAAEPRQNRGRRTGRIAAEPARHRRHENVRIG